MTRIRYPSCSKSGDCDEYYSICLKYICKYFEKRHEIEKIGMLIYERGGSNALQRCLEKLETLTSNEVKKCDLTDKEQKEVVAKVKKTVSSICKTIS